VITLCPNCHYANSLMYVLYENCSCGDFNRNYKILVIDHRKRHHHHCITTSISDFLSISQTHIFILAKHPTFTQVLKCCSNVPEGSTVLGYDTALLYTLHQNVGIQLTFITAPHFRRMELTYSHSTIPHYAVSTTLHTKLPYS
jgi:hypothetical protein